MTDSDDNFFSEDLLEDDSRPSPQLWGEDTELPNAAEPVSRQKPEPPRHSHAVSEPSYKQKTKARELTLQMLFQADVNPETPEHDIADQLRERLSEANLFQFSWDLYRGVLAEREKIDAAISATATNWKLSRMAVTDRNILRLGAYELEHVDTPYGVVLDEAIDMAKKFGTSQSASFVNGVLDKLVPESKRPGGSSRPLPPATTDASAGDDSQAPDRSEEISAYAKPEDLAKKGGPSPIRFRRSGGEDK